MRLERVDEQTAEGIRTSIQTHMAFPFLFRQMSLGMPLHGSMAMYNIFLTTQNVASLSAKRWRNPHGFMEAFWTATKQTFCRSDFYFCFSIKKSELNVRQYLCRWTLLFPKRHFATLSRAYNKLATRTT